MNFAASFSPRMEQAASHSICSMGLVEGTAGRRRDRRRVTRTADSVSLAAWLGSVDSRLGGKRRDRRSCRLLRPVRFALPAIDAGEGDTEPVCELLLREVEAGAGWLAGSRRWAVYLSCLICLQ